MSPGAPARGGPSGWLPVLWWLCTLALCAWQIARTPFTADLTAFLPQSPNAQQRLLIEQLQSGAPSRLFLLGIEGGDASARAQVSKAMAQRLRASGLFEQVQNGERAGFEALGAWLLEQRYLLSPDIKAEHFSPQGLREGIEDTLAWLGTPAGDALKPLLPRDPTGQLARIAQGLIPARAPRMEHGVWVSRETGDAKQPARALILAATRAAGSDIDAQQRALLSIEAAFASAQTELEPKVAASAVANSTQPAPPALPALKLLISGAPKFAVQSRAQIEREVNWLAGVGVLLMSALLWLAFASPLALLVAMMPVATGVVLGIAAVGAFFGNVHGITLGFGATLIGEAVDYAIYYLIQARQRPGGHGPLINGQTPAPARSPTPSPSDEPAGWQHWLATGWPTVRLGLWTSLCGFAALVFSGFPGLAQLGVFSIAGLVGAAVSTRYLLPRLMPNGAQGQGLRQRLGQVGATATRWLPRAKPLFLSLGAVALALVLWRGDLWRADLSALSPLPKDDLALDAQLRLDLAASDARTLVVVQGDSAEQALVRAEAVALRLEALVQIGSIAGYDSPTRLLPSMATQRARQASLPDAHALQQALVAATAGGPLDVQAKPERFAPFVDDVQTARKQNLLTPQNVQQSPAAPLVNAMMLTRSDGTVALLMPITAAQTPQTAQTVQATPAATDLTALLSQQLSGLPGAQALDVKAELDGLYARYLKEALWQSLIGAVAVLALVALALRQRRRILAVALPLLLAVLLCMGGLALHGQALGILHLVGLLLVVAVGSNYALFFEQMAQPQTLDASPVGELDTMASLLLANLTTVVSFGLLAFSKIPALSAIGQVVAPGAILALLLAAAFASKAR